MHAASVGANLVARVTGPLDRPLCSFGHLGGGKRGAELAATGVVHHPRWDESGRCVLSYLDETTWLKVPALVTHGDDDPRVPISASLRLNELKPSLVTFEVFPGAGHLESWNTDRARYRSLVESFLAPLAS
jgi:pimeloyl-ACP methyl ester carboxylesterase